MFKMEIKTGGAAFCNPHTGEKDDASEVEELIRIFKDVLMDMAHGVSSGVIMDSNGNKVGSWSK